MSVEENGHRNGENGEVSTREDSTAEHRFDDLARGVSTGTVPRRKALRMLAVSLFGGAAAAGFGLVAPMGAGAQPRQGGQGCPLPGQVRRGGRCVCPQGTTECDNRCVNNQCSGGRTFNAATCQCECAN